MVMVISDDDDDDDYEPEFSMSEWSTRRSRVDYIAHRKRARVV